MGVDLEMIRRQSNRQLPHAMALVEHAKALAERWNSYNPNEQVPHISVTGHSLGGTLAQATAYQYGLHGVTFNAYGAAELPGIPHNESTNQVINYVRATDVVSAGARHFGNTTILTTQKDIDMLNSYGYDNLPIRDTISMLHCTFLVYHTPSQTSQATPLCSVMNKSLKS